MPKSYPPGFRRKVLDLLAGGRSVTEVADDLRISGACIYNWSKQDRIDRGELPEHTRACGTRSCPPADQRIGGGARRGTTSQAVAEGGGAPRSRFAIIKMMTPDPVEVA